MRNIVFKAPFLNFSRDKAKVNAVISALKRKYAPRVVNPISIPTPSDPIIFADGLNSVSTGAVPKNAMAKTITKMKGGTQIKGDASSQRAASNTATSTIELLNLSPPGKVALGAHCSKIVTGVVHPINQQPVGWFHLEFSNSSSLSGIWTQDIFVGEVTSDPSSVGDFSFNMDFDADMYWQNVVSGKKYFRVCFNEMNVWSGNGYTTITLRSDPIELDFTQPACNVINAVRFSIAGSIVGATCDLEGGNNGNEPTFVVYLEKPALVEQTIRISTTNTTYGWISAGPTVSSNFIDINIGVGQSEGAISWFLGTKNVITTGKTFDVMAELINPDGTKGNYGLGTVNLLK